MKLEELQKILSNIKQYYSWENNIEISIGNSSGVFDSSIIDYEIQHPDDKIIVVLSDRYCFDYHCLDDYLPNISMIYPTENCFNRHWFLKDGKTVQEIKDIIEPVLSINPDWESMIRIDSSIDDSVNSNREVLVSTNNDSIKDLLTKSFRVQNKLGI